MILLKKMLKVWNKKSEEEKLAIYNNEIDNSLWSFDEVKAKFQFATNAGLTKQLLKKSCNDYNDFMRLDIGFIYSKNDDEVVVEDDNNMDLSNEQETETEVEAETETETENDEEMHLDQETQTEDDEEMNLDQETKTEDDEEMNLDQEHENYAFNDLDVEVVNEQDSEIEDSLKDAMDEIVNDIETEISASNMDDEHSSYDSTDLSEKIADLKNKISFDDDYIIYSQHQLCTLLSADEKYSEKEKERLIISAEKKIAFLQNLIDSSKDDRESFIDTMLKNVTEAYARFKENNEI